MSTPDTKKPKIKDYLLLHFILLLYSFIAVISKFSAGFSFPSTEFLLSYGLIILILGIYAILWQQVLKKMSLVRAFSNKSITIVWGMIWGFLFFKEQITWNMLVGTVVIFIGVYLVVSDNG